MLQLLNSTPFAASFGIFPDLEGVDTLYVAVKGTFTVEDGIKLAESQCPVRAVDEYWGEPGLSSLKYVSDMHLSKPSTDVALVGSARTPRQKKKRQLDVELCVADFKKTIRVFGDREWKMGLLSASPTAPTEFSSMPLVYERAYGGVHKIDPEGDIALAEERNPVGVGFLGKRKAKELAGQPLPNLEDPDRLISKPGDEVHPTGFGFVAPAWLPRRAFAGTYDESWQKSRAPILPEDFDPRFFNAAHPDLTLDRYLEGGEQVRVTNVSPHGPLQFRLPEVRVEVDVRIAGRSERPDPNLETVLIEPDEDRLCLTWRAAVPCDKSMLKIEEIRLELDRLAIEE